MKLRKLFQYLLRAFNENDSSFIIDVKCIKFFEMLVFVNAKDAVPAKRKKKSNYFVAE